MSTRPIPTYWCPTCKNTSVADENEDGSITCHMCEELRVGASAEINGIRNDLRGLMDRAQHERCPRQSKRDALRHF